MTRALYADATGCAVFNEAFVGDNSPFDDPLNHLPDIFFHSSNDYYALAMAPVVVNISHALIPADTGLLIAGSDIHNPAIRQYYAMTPTDWLLVNHALGYVPHYMVLDANGYTLPNAWPIQKNVGGHRGASFYATTADIRLYEMALPGNVSLAAISLAYTVYVFKAPAADPLKPMLEIDIPNGSVIFGQGKFDDSYSMLRRVQGVESPSLYIPAGRMTDIKNGCSRFIQANGTIVDLNNSVDSYNGTYTGVAAIQAVVN